MTIEEKIKTEFRESKELTVKELTFRLQVSKQMVHLVLKRLVESGFLEKLGRAPKTVYRIKEGRVEYVQDLSKLNVTEEEQGYLNSDFLVVTEMGNLLEGLAAFDYWCQKRKLPTQKTLGEWMKTKKKYAGYYDENKIIEGTTKLVKTYGNQTFLDAVYYLDFYAIERFGKTRLGTLLHYAKQGQNIFLMNKMMDEIQGRITKFIVRNKVDAVCFVPPTVRREIQIMKFIQERLRVSLPVLEILKISGIIPVPQKSLNKLEDRIRNAENTFAVTDPRQFKKVLLIDDAVGSGSTLNEIAKKIKTKKIAKTVLGMAVVGSFKGFDVITDV